MIMPASTPITATLIPGDGIGPETVESALQILDALASPFQWDVQQAGVAGLDTLNIDSVRTRDLKGDATTKQFTDAVCQRL